MNAGEHHDEQSPARLPQQHPPCAHDPARGECRCDDDGTASHGGTDAERHELIGGGYPRQARGG